MIVFNLMKLTEKALFIPGEKIEMCVRSQKFVEINNVLVTKSQGSHASSD